MSPNDEDAHHSEEPRPEKEAATADAPEWDPGAAFGELPADEMTEAEASSETLLVAAVAEPDGSTAEPAFDMPPADLALEFEASEADVEASADEEAVASQAAEPVFEMPPADLALEFEADEADVEASADEEAVASQAAEPVFEMPPADFALEFDGGEAADADGNIAAPDTDGPGLELPTDLPEWDPAAEFSPESFAEPVPVEASSPVVTETNVFTSLAPDPFDFSSIPEPVFEPESFAEAPEPIGAEAHPPVSETVASIPVGSASGLERVLATIDAEVAVSDRRPATPTAASTAAVGTSFVGFVHGGGRFAFSIEGITEITRSVRTTPVPFTPEWVVGVTNLRGDILAVADFGLMLGSGAVGSRDGAYMIVLQGKRTPFSLGLLVDAVTGMRTFGEEDILTPTAPLGDRVTQFARGVTGAGAELTVVLDVEAFLALPEMQQFSQN